MWDRWLIRAYMWSKNPPPAKRVVFVLAVIAFCLVVYAIDRTIGFPDWMRVNDMRGARLPR